MRRSVSAVGQQPVRLVVTTRVAPGDLHFPAVDVEDYRLVLEEQSGLDIAQVGGTAKGVARGGNVVVPQHGVRPVAGVQPAELGDQRAHAPPAADQVSGYRDEIEVGAGRPVDCLAEGAAVQRDGAEVKVGDVENSEAVELGRKARDRRLLLEQLDPLGLEKPPREPGRGHYRDRDEDPSHLDARPLVGVLTGDGCDQAGRRDRLQAVPAGTGKSERDDPAPRRSRQPWVR